MALQPKQTSWFNFALGQKLDPDLSYGLQCVDTVDHYAQFIFQVPWQECVGPVPGGARQLFAVAPAKYWIKIANTPTGMPEKGDVLVFDGWPTNTFGHTAVVEKTSPTTGTMFQQDGFASPLQFVNGGWYSNKPTHRATYTWPGLPGGFPGRLIGWLRPRPEMIKNDQALKATMDGIDVASYQSTIKQASVPAEFVIVKATEGTGYTNPYFRAQLLDARNDGAKVGLYHFMRNNDPRAEADYFLKQTTGLIDNKTMLVLDFEAAELLNPAGAEKAYQWLTYIAAKTGKTPILYMNYSVANTYAWWQKVQEAGFNRLWLAQYPAGTATQGYGPKIKRSFPKMWQIVMWQYSQYGRLPGYAGNLDLNLFYGTPTVWDKLAAPVNVTPGGGLGADDTEFDKLMESIMAWYKSQKVFEDRMRVLAKEGAAANNSKLVRELLTYNNTTRTPRDLYALIVDAGLNSTSAKNGVNKLLDWVASFPSKIREWISPAPSTPTVDETKEV